MTETIPPTTPAHQVSRDPVRGLRVVLEGRAERVGVHRAVRSTVVRAPGTTAHPQRVAHRHSGSVNAGAGREHRRPNAGRRGRARRAAERNRPPGRGLGLHPTFPGADIATAAFERQRLEAAGLLSGGLAYRLFFWLVPLGLVFAAALSFWYESDRAGARGRRERVRHRRRGDALRHGRDRAGEPFRVVLPRRRVVLLPLVYCSASSGRSFIAHALAWRLPPEKLRAAACRQPRSSTRSSSAWSLVSSSAQLLREQLGGHGRRAVSRCCSASTSGSRPG